MDISKYKDLFLSEAKEHLDSLDTGLVTLEKDPNNQEIMKDLMRHAHTLKGMASSMEYGEISNLAHSFEGMMENKKNDIATGQIKLLYGAVDELRRLVSLVENGEETEKKENPLVDKVGELEEVENKSDESVVLHPEKISKITEIKVKTDKLDKIMQLTSELMLNSMQLNKLITKLENQDISNLIDKNNKLIEDLQFHVLQIRLTPIAQVFNRFPRMIRDLSTKLNKEINFVIQDGEIELDRDVLDEIAEPLVHLLRNAVDHGTQSKGEIILKAERERDNVLVSVKDDGNGIDWDKLKEKAKGRIFKDNKDLLFMGLTTSSSVTEISGRGVGMDVVRSAVEKIGGDIDVISEKNKGTQFILTLPLTVAIIKALIVSVEDKLYAIPGNVIERIIEVDNINIKKQADQDIIALDEIEIPIIDLSKILITETTSEKIDSADTKSIGVTNKETVILVNTNGSIYGYKVDKAIKQQDIIVKTLSKDLRQQIHISAVTISEDGLPIPIIDLRSIMKEINKDGN